MTDDVWNEAVAFSYEQRWPEIHDPAVVGPIVDFLADLAGSGAALELAIGTGRIGRALHARGVPVSGIELSPAMVAALRAAPGGSDIPVVVGDMTSATVEGTFSLVYLVANTITNVLTQDAQVACFRNAAAHLAPGGAFVVENYVPELRRVPLDETAHVFAATPEHLAYESYDDLVGQVAWSHHVWFRDDGTAERSSSAHRYAWPAELDLMARLAGLALRERWADWHRAPFTGASRSHVSVWVRE